MHLQWSKNLGSVPTCTTDKYDEDCDNQEQCQCYYTLESSLPLGVLELKAFNHPWTYQVSYVFPPPALVPLVFSNLLAVHVTCQFRLILMAPCWMEAPRLLSVFNMLADIPHWCPTVKDHIIDVSVCWVLKELQLLHLTLWLLRCVLCRQWFLSSVCQVVVGTTWESTTKVCQQCWKEWATYCAWESVPNNAISAPKWAEFVVHLFRVGLTWHISGIDHSVISAFLEHIIFMRHGIIWSSLN